MDEILSGLKDFVCIVVVERVIEKIGLNFEESEIENKDEQNLMTEQDSTVNKVLFANAVIEGTNVTYEQETCRNTEDFGTLDLAGKIPVPEGPEIVNTDGASPDFEQTSGFAVNT
jgi:hypothetical protein